MSSSAIATVNGLKDALTKETSSSSGGDEERIRDILKRLDETPVTLKVLSETLVGASVSKVKSHSDAEVAAAAKALVKKWKKLAKESGVGKGGKPVLERGESSASVGSGASGSAKKAASAGDSASSGVESEFSHLPTLRKNICVKLHSVLLLSKEELTKGSDGLDASALDQLCISRAGEVEEAIQNQSRGEKSAYTDKVRSLVFNMKKNGELRISVLMGQTPPDKLVTMSPDELATSEKAKERADLVGNLQDSRRLDWEQANEKKINDMCGIKGDLLKASLFTCGRCKSIKTTSTQKQTRSADEPMTVFVLCLNCGNRWKC